MDKEIKWAKGAKQNDYTAIPKSSFSVEGDVYSRCFNKMIYLIDLNNNKIDKKQKEDVEFRNKINRLPLIKKIRFYKKKLRDLKNDLLFINQSKNSMKINIIGPTIKAQIKEINEILDCLYAEQNE